MHAPWVSAYTLRITLEEVEPPVWRRLLLPADIRLPRLARILEEAMGWNRTHLHEFRTGTVSFSAPDPEWDEYMINERVVRLSQLLRHPGDRCEFIYDLGDHWSHELLLEEVVENSGSLPGGVPQPRVLDGERACPPDDCGGVHGYAELLGALRDVDHPEHEEWRTWAGDLDPERFDLEEANRRVRRAR